MRSEGPLFFRATATSVQRRPVVVKRAGRWHRSNIEEGRDNEVAALFATLEGKGIPTHAEVLDEIAREEKGCLHAR